MRDVYKDILQNDAPVARPNTCCDPDSANAPPLEDPAVPPCPEGQGVYTLKCERKLDGTCEKSWAID